MQNEPNLEGESCKTNPISADRPGPQRANCAKRTQFGPSARTTAGEIRETNPIDGGPECEMRQTNPIWPGRPGMGAGSRGTPPASDGAKQSQRAVAGSQLSVVGWGIAAPNKANLLSAKTRDKCFLKNDLWRL
jgi:hypothetical protein